MSKAQVSVTPQTTHSQLSPVNQCDHSLVVVTFFKRVTVGCSKKVCESVVQYCSSCSALWRKQDTFLGCNSVFFQLLKPPFQQCGPDATLDNLSYPCAGVVELLVIRWQVVTGERRDDVGVQSSVRQITKHDIAGRQIVQELLSVQRTMRLPSCGMCFRHSEWWCDGCDVVCQRRIVRWWSRTTCRVCRRSRRLQHRQASRLGRWSCQWTAWHGTAGDPVIYAAAVPVVAAHWLPGAECAYTHRQKLTVGRFDYSAPCRILS